MNRRPTNNIVTNNNSHSNILNARTFGTEYTTIDKVADLRDIKEASIYNFDQNAINFNNVISYYPFNDLSYNTPLPSETTNTDISNQSLAGNLKTPKPFSLEFKSPSSIIGTLYKPKVVYNDLISQNVIQLDPSSQVLATALHFNKDNAFNSTSNTDITTALTMACFVYIQDSDVSSTPGDSKQFCLFAMDDLNQTALQNFSSTPTTTGSDNLLYLWYPNKNGKAQLLYGYKSKNATQSWSYISKESTEHIPTNKWTQVILVLAGTSIYVIVDGILVILSSGSDIQGASYVPDQPFNINLGPYYYDTSISANLTTTNTATPLLSDCKLANWAVSPELAAALASPRGYGHQYAVEEEPNKEGLLYYLLSKELLSFSTPTLFRSELNLGGDLQSYGTNNLYGKNNFYTKVYFADGFIADASSTIVYQGSTGNVFIDSSTPVTTQKNASLLISNSSETGGNQPMASMLVYNYVSDISNVLKSDLPNYTDKLQFSISGENISVGHGFGDSSFNVFGDSTLSNNLTVDGKIDMSKGVALNGQYGTTTLPIGASSTSDIYNTQQLIHFITDPTENPSSDWAMFSSETKEESGSDRGIFVLTVGDNSDSQNDKFIIRGNNINGGGSATWNNKDLAYFSSQNGVVLTDTTIYGQLDVSNNSLRITTTDSNCSLLINEEIGTTLTTTAGSLIISHGDRNGQSSILFPSTRNSTDYAAIQYQETDPTGDPDNEKGILRLICENDATTNHEDQIRFKTGDGDRMTIRGSGNVGIGTTNPTTTLEVVGDISASSINTSSFSGNPTFNGTVTAVSFNATSDVRLKENITNLDNSLDKICNIRGVNYNWKNDETKTKTAGVIAQEVLEQIPEAVNDNDSEKLSVNYNSIIAHLIESVKELKREIDELKAK